MSTASRATVENHFFEAPLVAEGWPERFPILIHQTGRGC
jgi:hypothetical protein